MPKVSIILPTYNRAYILCRAIDSVLNQTFEDFELIIVNDNSTDGTLNILNTYNDSRIIVINNSSNQGAACSRKIGISKAKGKYIAFIDSDNMWYRNKLQRQIEVMEKLGDEYAYTFCQYESGDLKQRRFPSNSFKPDNYHNDIFVNNVVDTNTVMIRKSVINENSTFEKCFEPIEDWEFFMRLIICEGYKFFYIKEVLVYYELQLNSISSNNSKQIEGRISFVKKYYEELKKRNNLEKWLSDILGYTKDYNEFSEVLFLLKKELGTKTDFSLLENRILHNYIRNSLFSSNKYYQLLIDWKTKNEKIRPQTVVTKYLRDNEYNSIALYGLGQWGQMIYDELKASEHRIVCGMDCDSEWFDGLSIYRIGDDLPHIDVIIVSIFGSYETISKELKKYYSYKIVSIEAIINEVRIDD